MGFKNLSLNSNLILLRSKNADYDRILCHLLKCSLCGQFLMDSLCILEQNVYSLAMLYKCALIHELVIVFFKYSIY